jgi:hypothetical protein
MALSKAKRKALREAGMSKAELDKLEGILDADDDEGASGVGAGGRVVVYEGKDAESFMRKMFGKAQDDDEGDDDEGDEGDEGDDEGDEGDEAPPAKPRWFGGK